MKIVFYGTPDFAVPTLDALVAAGHDVALVVAQPDKPAGRGQAMSAPPIAARATALGIEIAQPKAIRSGPFPARIRAIAADVAVVIAYGRILTPELLAAPRLGCVNVHASLLPRWRGAAPIQRAVLAGDAVTGVCTQRMEEGLDTGPIFLSEPTPIGPRETAGALHDRLAILAAGVAVETLRIVEVAVPAPQDEREATYAPKLDKEEARIDFALSAVELDRKVRGYHPWPGASVETAKGPLKLEAVEPLPGDAPPGVIVSVDPLVVGCALGLIELRTVRPAGRRAMSGHQYANGARLRAGERLLGS